MLELPIRFNGDGRSDVLVGAPSDSTVYSQGGRGYLYYGRLAVSVVPDIVFDPTGSNQLLGADVASAGDVNADGFDDLVIGGPQPVPSGTGNAYIYRGSASGWSTPVVLTGEGLYDGFGQSVAGGGDVNGDGYADVLVGAPANDAGADNAGRAYLFLGGGSMDATADVVFTGASAQDQLGRSVGTGGDLNGDGYSDIAVGIYLSDAAGIDSGQVLTYFGGSTVDNTADIVLNGEAAGDMFGEDVALGPDINGDGFGELAVGAPNNDFGGPNGGRVYLWFGGSTPDTTPDIIFTGAGAGDYSDTLSPVAFCDDFNGDGYGDLLLGAPGNEAAGESAGQAYVHYGGPTMDNVADVTIRAEAANMSLGWDVSGAGDFNADGYADVVVGLPRYASSRGDANLYFGGSSPDGVHKPLGYHGDMRRWSTNADGAVLQSVARGQEFATASNDGCRSRTCVIPRG